ncbi:hypothetical protein [Planctopirus hydrillae]|uniref:Uncharacterized protein n=1 Tax=Planctopirus hydrillae TaxID=1841610 RepID=A0A1C3ENB0_9PLAN|nr:hypothetical protein [Planctopirus hydrillae]ODA34712.1 hypothetical protein A6X21_03310 [Planctopirus hydrillae]
MAETQDTPAPPDQPEPPPRPRSLWQIMRGKSSIDSSPPPAETLAVDPETSQPQTVEADCDPEEMIFSTRGIPPLRGLWHVMQEQKKPLRLPAAPAFRSLQRQPAPAIRSETAPLADGQQTAPPAPAERLRQARWYTAGMQFRASHREIAGRSPYLLRRTRTVTVPSVDRQNGLEAIEPIGASELEAELLYERLSPVTTAWTWIGRGATSTLAAFLFAPLAKWESLWWEMPATVFGFGGLVCACLAMTESERRFSQSAGPHGDHAARQTTDIQLLLAALLLLASTTSIFIGPLIWG